MSRHQPVSPFERAAFHHRASAGLDLGALNLQAIVPQAVAPMVQAQPQPVLNMNTQVETFLPGFTSRAANRYTLTIYDLPPNMLFTAGAGVIAAYSGPVPYTDAALTPVGRAGLQNQLVYMSPGTGTVSLLTSESQFPNPMGVREDEVRAFW